ncbi:hypothetical protein Tco_0927468 [Tanacetum coccineum]
MLPSSGFLMLSKPVKKTTRVSLVPGNERCRTTVYFCEVAHPRDRQDLLNPGLAAWARYSLFTTFLRSSPSFICFLHVCSLLPIFSSFLFLLSGCSPFESLIMSLEESDDLVILDAKPVGPALEAGSLPKFDMHIHRSSLTEIQVRWLTKCYGILEDLHPRVVPKGMTMNALPNDAIGLYAHHF